MKNLCKLFAFASKGTPRSKKAARGVRAEPRGVRAEPRSVRAEPRPSSARGRIRRRVPDEPRRARSPHGSRRYNDRPRVYEREAVVPPIHTVQPLPAPLPYAYDEMDAYRRDPPPLEHRGHLFLDYDQTRRDDRYFYGEREQQPLSYPRGYNYAPPAEYNYVPPPALPPPRYHYPDPAASDYRSYAGVRAEYHISSEGRSEYRSSARDRVYRL